MTTDSVTVHVPHALYAELEARARHTRRSVEEEILEVVAEAISLPERPLPADDHAAPELPDAMSDEALWHLARTSRLSPAAAAHLEELNQKRQREGLSVDEQRMAEALLHQYEHALLTRAAAMARLQDRGQDIATLLVPIIA